MFEYNNKGIYVCTDCGELYSVGHSTRCGKQERKSDSGKPNKVSNIGQQIDIGMRMIHAAEDECYFDITEFIKRGQE